MTRKKNVQQLLLVLVLGMVGTGRAAAEDPVVPPAPTAPAAPESPAPPAPSEERVRQEKLRQELRAKLEGTRWTLQLTSGEAGTTPLQDTLTFKSGQVTSERLAKLGYGSSNCSLSFEGDAGIWETMQRKEGAGVVFWRGELRDDSMQGMISEQPAKGAAKEYSFTGAKAEADASQLPEAAPAPAESAAEVQQAPEAVVHAPAPPAQPPAAAPAQTAPKPEAKKKKKGWF